MTTETAAPAASEGAPVVAAPNLESGDSYSTEQAFEAYQKRNNPTAESAEPATAETESADEADAGPVEAPSETEATDQAEQPPIDAPRSWTKEDKELFSSLPRETQERLAERERSREGDFLRRQNEATEAGKALAAELEQAKQARVQYEAKQAAYTKNLSDALQAEFGDIQSMNDVRKLQAEDPFRFQAWQLRQMELSQAQTEQQALEQQKTRERQSKRAAYEAEQNKALADLVPEMADPKKGAEMRDRAVKMLTDDLGLTMNQLQSWMADDTGHEILSNAGIQKLIADRLKFNEIKAAPPKAIPKPVPAVVKPGVVASKGAHAAETVQAHRNKLSGTGSMEDAFALYQAKKSRRA
jgi:hypothetical protein